MGDYAVGAMLDEAFMSCMKALFSFAIYMDSIRQALLHDIRKSTSCRSTADFCKLLASQRLQWRYSDVLSVVFGDTALM